MKPVKQTDTSFETGNCLQACVASIFELELDEVPHFISYGDDWWFQYRDFLAARNISVVWTTKFVPIGAWHIASVNSPRYAGGSHAVVCDTEGKIVHDPHPDVTDLSINGDPVGYHWFYVTDPAKMVG